MSLTIDLESEEGLCIGNASGTLTLEEIKDSAEAMWRLIEGGDRRMLWDLRESNFDLDTAQVSDLAETMKEVIPANERRVAFVVSEDLEYGLVRMYKALRDSDGSRTSVFRDRDEAIRWLRTIET